MRKALFIVLLLSASLLSAKEKGEKCMMDTECGFNLECQNGVCVKKKEFDTGSHGSGKSCQIDADCIGAGKCKKNNFGQGVCTGH